MGGGDEPGCDQSAPGSAGSSDQGLPNPKAAQCDATIPVQECHGGGSTPHQNVCGIHHLLPERGIVQHVHRFDPPSQKCPACPHPCQIQPLLPNALVL